MRVLSGSTTRTSSVTERVVEARIGVVEAGICFASPLKDTMDLNTSTGDASAIGSWKRLLRVFTEPERRTSRERRRGRDPLRREDWSEGKRQTIRRAGDRG